MFNMDLYTLYNTRELYNMKEKGRPFLNKDDKGANFR